MCNTFTPQIKGNHWYTYTRHVYLIPMIPVLQLNANRLYSNVSQERGGHQVYTTL